MTDPRKEAEGALNACVARMLVDFTPDNVRDSIHAITVLEAICAREGDAESTDRATGVKGDLERLHRAMLFFESDPEIIKRNWIAMLFNSLSPFIVSIEEYMTGEDRPLWQLGITASVILTEAMGALQYLSSVQISAAVHFEEELMALQVRSYDISLERVGSPGEVKEATDSVRDFFDQVRSLNLTPGHKPGMLLILHLIVFIVSYGSLRLSLA